MKYLKKIPRALVLLILLQISWLALRTVRFERIRDFLEKRSRFRPFRNPEPSIPLLRSVSARLPWLDTCLVRAVAYALLLRWSRGAGTLRIGVQKNEQIGFEAHAAIVNQDERIVLGDREDWENFAELVSVAISAGN